MGVSKNETPVGVAITFFETPTLHRWNTHYNCFTISVKIHHTTQTGTQLMTKNIEYKIFASQNLLICVFASTLAKFIFTSKSLVNHNPQNKSKSIIESDAKGQPKTQLAKKLEIAFCVFLHMSKACESGFFDAKFGKANCWKTQCCLLIFSLALTWLANCVCSAKNVQLCIDPWCYGSHFSFHPLSGVQL